MDYDRLLEFCSTEKRKKLVRAVDACHGSVTNAVRLLGWTSPITNYHRMFREIVGKAEDADNQTTPQRKSGLKEPKPRPPLMTRKPKILFLDIETSLILAYTFGIRDQHITYKQIANDREGRLIHCVGLKWKGGKAWVLSEWDHGYEGMIKGVHDALAEADAVVTYNGAKFDMPKLEGQFELLGMEPPPPPTQIDLYLAARKLGHICNKLDYLAPLMGLGGKVKHPGLEMWIGCFQGEEASQKKMARYCAGDVRLTEDLYDRLRPYIRNHPHLADTGKLHCGACGSSRLQSRGFQRTKASIYQRYQCQACGSWSKGKREAAA